MGKFEDSFKREMGKNTGKFVSNLIFGDMHSTPYRRVGTPQYRAPQYREPRKTAAELRHEREMERIEAEDTRRYQAQLFENKRLEKEQLLAIDSAVLKNIDAIASIRIPNDKDDLVHLLSELSTQIRANKRHKNDEEGRIRNKFTDALLEKYKQCVLKLKSIAPDDPQTEYYEGIIKEIKRKQFKAKYLKQIIWCSVIFLFVILPMVIGILVANDVFYDFMEGITFVFYSFLVVAGLILIFWLTKKYLKNKRKAERKRQLENASHQADFKPQQIINQDIVFPIVEDSIFIDLNENSRIERKLTAIWTRYKNSIDKQIINRKPIFSADGVKDSILFIGVNPSYNPNDDKIFVHSADDKSLMYGSLYQISDAPDYFKALEIFAAQLGKTYSHINLLYARENDRDLLLQQDHNFIREQLELTYDTILKINPKVIVFFTDYCHDLVFGEERWVAPSSERVGTYILKGTNFPVVFSDDITTLDEKEQIAINHKIRFCLDRRQY